VAEYLTSTDLSNRLTVVGFAYVADANSNGTISSEETAASVTPHIQYAGNIVDAYICKQVDPRVARGADNGYLRDRAIDIAAHRAILMATGSVPADVKAAFDFTMEELVSIRDGGQRIPLFPYPSPVNARAISHVPKVANIGGCRSGRCGGGFRGRGSLGGID